VEGWIVNDFEASYFSIIQNRLTQIALYWSGGLLLRHVCWDLLFLVYLRKPDIIKCGGIIFYFASMIKLIKMWFNLHFINTNSNVTFTHDPGMNCSTSFSEYGKEKLKLPKTSWLKQTFVYPWSSQAMQNVGQIFRQEHNVWHDCAREEGKWKIPYQLRDEARLKICVMSDLNQLKRSEQSGRATVILSGNLDE